MGAERVVSHGSPADGAERASEVRAAEHMDERSACQQAPFGLLGRTLGHSWSPRIHAVLGSMPYALFEREPEEVEAFVREGSWRGLNVTIPYKRVAAELADERSPRVEVLGAANTLVRRADGTIFADNTDVLGFAWMLKRFCRRDLGASTSELLAGRKALVLGTGGASEAVRAALEAQGAQVVRISRTGDETYQTLAQRHGDAVLLVNTTPVGMHPHCPASPLDDATLDALHDLRGVLDVVYNPLRTGLCLAAERRGLPFESGLSMLVAQAVRSSEQFLGRTHSDDAIERIERELTAAMTNIVLIGMPGVGKTSTGASLAHQLGRPFIDLDDAFAIAEGIEPGTYIVARGEPAFRDAETRVLAANASRGGLVMACGGGVVVRPENYALLHQNGTIVMLDRPLEDLSTKGRPLSQSEGIARLAAERMPLYQSWADLRLSCTGGPTGDAEAIRNALGLA